MADFPSHCNSYWSATAPARSDLPRLSEDTETDVVVIGAGFTGISTAYRLVSTGCSCVVLDAFDVGWGASGRNGGMVVPRYKHTFPELAARYGAVVALNMHRLAHRAVDLLEEIVARESIDCDFARYGHITPVVQDSAVRRFEMDQEWLRREAGDTVPQMLNGAELRRRIGSRLYRGGYFEPRGGAVHPLKLCLGIADAVVRKGGRIFGGTVARSWRGDGSNLLVETDTARLRAKRVIIATNAYASLGGAGSALERRVIPVTSSLIATDPLSQGLRSEILPDGSVVTDAKRLTNYFRVSTDGRLLFGGRGGASLTESPRVFRRLAREMKQIFPQVGDLSVAFRWSGHVAVTLDGLPRVGRLAHNVSYATGYNGRGVALSILFGHLLGDDAVSDDALGPMQGPLAHIPFWPLQVPLKKMATTYYQVLDRVGL
jgi:gamma-glutamylputrescine oxidase